jgi:2-amino-4-hydroxy-6-hydroxymethyldihydropteridine diphosphokinase
MTHKLYLGLGSNLDDREANIRRALTLIDERLGSVYRVSSFIETEPVDFCSKHRFINAVCLVHTMMSPISCLRETQKIEQELGRIQKSICTDGTLQHFDRTIDIDLLIYDDLIIKTPELTLPTLA